jgi:hypothetical protein
VHLLVKHNMITCNALTLEGFNGDVMKVTLKPVGRTNAVMAPHTKERIELLSQAKTHGNIFAATGGIHLTDNDIFKSIALKQRKLTREKLKREKTLRNCQERNQVAAEEILQEKRVNPTALTSADLSALLTWHQFPKVAGMKKEEKLVAWMQIKAVEKPPLRSTGGPTPTKKNCWRRSPTSSRWPTPPSDTSKK